jgi:hypothetical protein
METYLRFGIVGSYQQKNRNCGNLSEKIGIVGTYEKNRKKSELWEHIYILKFGIVGTYLKNRNYVNIYYMSH